MSEWKIQSSLGTVKTEINKNITAFEDPSGAKILLAPTDPGCLVQKKKLAYGTKTKINIKLIT